MTSSQRLLAAGFGEWQFADYAAFIAACKRYGGKPAVLEKVIKAMSERGKPRDMITRYHSTFFDRAPHMSSFKGALEKIARGEARAKKFAELEDLLERLLAAYPQRADVMERLAIYHTPMLKGRGFSLHEDRFLLYWCRLLGYGEWPKLRAQIRRDAEFRFDYFLKSRSCAEINRRVDALLRSMQKEDAKQQTKKAKLDGETKGGRDRADLPTSVAADAARWSHSTPAAGHRVLDGDGGLMPVSLSASASAYPSPSSSPVMFHRGDGRANVSSSRGPTAHVSQLDSEEGEAAAAACEDAPLIIKRRALRAEDAATHSSSSSSAHPGASVDPVVGLTFSPSLLAASSDVVMSLEDHAAAAAVLHADDPNEDMPLIERKRYLHALAATRMEEEEFGHEEEPSHKRLENA